MSALEAMRKALAALEAVNDFDCHIQLLPTPLWRDVMAAQGHMREAIAAEESKARVPA